VDAKKRSVAASERDEAARAAWRAALKGAAVEDLVFVDEMGSHTSLALAYGWAPRGERAVARVPRNHGKNTTLVAALSLEGISAAMTVEGALDTPAFEAYVEHILAPTLRPGQLVVLDNLAVHHKAAIRQMLAARGCRVLYLPSYSPDLTPIEQAFAKIKAELRRLGARTREALEATIAQAIDHVTPRDACGFFRHCGYHSPAQLL
jgi:transposase